MMYSQVLSIACEVKWGLEKKSRSQKQIESAKWTFQQIDREDSVKLIGASLTIVCGYYRRPDIYSEIAE